jgi:hypothetical protein
MCSIAYGSPATPNVADDTPRKSLFVRLLETIVESRMRKAEAEIARVCRFWPIH